MPRTPDPARRAELLSATVDYAVENGVARLTLRPLAQALGVQPNTLVHHFGGKEELLSAILNGVRDRLRTMRLEMQDDVDADPLRGIWEWTASPARERFFRFFFETYGLALGQPERYGPFLERVVSDWIDPPYPVRATLELAVLRGLLLDLLTTGDRKRVEDALQRFCEQRRATASGSRSGTEALARP